MALQPPFTVEVGLGEILDWDFNKGDLREDFTPHTVTVDAGDDIALEIMSFCQQDSRTICVLTGTGAISKVTLRHPNSSSGILTYEGYFELISLSGSFIPTDNGIVMGRRGGVSVSLAGAGGIVFGGGLAGALIAATPVQMVLGSFMSGNPQERKPKKQRIESVPTVMPAVINQVPDGGGYGGQNMNFGSPTPTFRTDSLPSMNSTTLTQTTHSTQHYLIDLEADNGISLEGDSGVFNDVDPQIYLDLLAILTCVELRKCSIVTCIVLQVGNLAF